MSKNWYPIIDTEKCIECGICVNHCSHNVYDKEKSPVPIVVFEQNCIDGCGGCASKCPTNAISYIGDKKDNANSCGCNCNGKCN